jgi:hypothetical protein
MAFVDLDDQFLNLSAGRRQATDDERRFGLVVDDRQSVLDRLDEPGIPLLPGPFKDFLDPWRNRIELVDYATIQFSKTPQVLRGMGLDGLDKSEEAPDELREKGMASD